MVAASSAWINHVGVNSIKSVINHRGLILSVLNIAFFIITGPPRKLETVIRISEDTNMYRVSRDMNIRDSLQAVS